MPLLHSKSDVAFKPNVRALLGEIGRSPHVKNRSQALAVAYSEKRRAKRAYGGPAPVPWQVKAEARNLSHTGPILSAVPGRTDRHNMNVPSGSYVMPAQAVSHLGQSNTMAGMKILGNMFHTGPYGASSVGIKTGSGAPRPPRAMGLSDRGGPRGEGVGTPTPIVAAGGEFVIPPEAIIARYGNLKHGHTVLDAWVKQIQKDHARTIQKLPGPAKS